MILDVKATRSISAFKRSLRPKGRCFLVGGKASKVFTAFFFGSFGGKKVKVVLYNPNKDLQTLTDLIVAGKVRPIIDKRYPLSDVGKAIRHLGDGHVKGKVVITV
ncbi:MAG: zinc-binding dehydrogenase [Thermoplasmata archaeon]|nr:zinc-binding dehydrogenase [Thermoplasmata archaeon]